MVSILLAGCALAPEDEAAPPLTGAILACPAGETEQRESACIGRIVEPGVQLSEPAIAVLPSDARVMAVAAHAIGASGNVVAGYAYVTRDGGATWARSSLPLPAGATFSDPALAYAPDGTLHATGMAVYANKPVEIFHAKTADDGRTWSAPVIVSEPGERWDRNWVSVSPEGRVFASWHSPFVTSLAAWSDDDGATWTRAEPAHEGCHTASPVAFYGGEALLSCFNAEEGILHVHRINVENATLVPFARVGLSCGPSRILAPVDGSLIVTCYEPYYARSTDGGATWTNYLVAEIATVEDAQPDMQLYWSEVDARGVLHLQLSPFHRTPMNSNDPGALVGDLRRAQETPRFVAHVALAPDGTLLSEAVVTTQQPEGEAAPPISLVPSVGDDWNGIAFAGNEGAMVWMNGGVLELTRVLPAS